MTISHISSASDPVAATRDNLNRVNVRQDSDVDLGILYTGKSFGDRSEIHQGALVLDTHSPAARPDTLTGEYWTDRNTTGRLTVSGRVSQVLTRYEDAERAHQ